MQNTRYAFDVQHYMQTGEKVYYTDPNGNPIGVTRDWYNNGILILQGKLQTDFTVDAAFYGIGAAGESLFFKEGTDGWIAGGIRAVGKRSWKVFNTWVDGTVKANVQNIKDDTKSHNTNKSKGGQPAGNNGTGGAGGAGGAGGTSSVNGTNGQYLTTMQVAIMVNRAKEEQDRKSVV